LEPSPSWHGSAAARPGEGNSLRAVRKTVAFVEFTPSGGLFQFSVQLAGGMAAAGDDVHFYTGPDPELRPDVAGLTIHATLPTWHPADKEPVNKYVKKVRRALRAGQLGVAWLKVLFLLARRRPDAVIWSSWKFSMDAGGVLLVRRLLPKAMLALVAHEPVPRVRADTTKERHGRVLDPALTKAWRSLDTVFVLGDGARAKAIERWGITCPVVVIPHGDESALRGDAPIPAVADTEPVVLFFGAWTAYKGIDLLFDAIPAVYEKVPDARFVVAGSVLGVNYDVLGARARELRVDARPGYVDTADVPTLFGEARVVVTPYRRATQSGVVHLAYTFDRPIVATAVGDIPQVVQDGVTGILVAPDDAGALADGLVALLSDPGRAQAMGTAGGAWLTAEASWPVVGTKVHDALEAARAKA
jgi:glycosyltransferase involved in cell wall biosynthesis